MAGSSRQPRRGSSPRSSAAEIGQYVARGSNRAFVVVVLFLLMALVFFVRLVFLQVIIAPQYAAEAETSRTAGFYVEPRRGTIYDRNGRVLAISVDATTVYANPSEIEDPSYAANRVADILGGESKDYIERLSQGDSATFTFIQRKADVDAAEKLREEQIPGIYFIDDTRREYPYGRVGGQVIGACSVAVDEEKNREYYEGICGMEMYYNTILSGTPGYYEAEKGADGTPIPGGVHVSEQPVEGQDIVISIDIEFQSELESDLRAGLKQISVDSGTAVVMDSSNGEIYAAASLPFFNPADRSEVPEGSMQLKAATSLFEPGSIFKTVSCTAVLEEGKMTPDTKVDCPSYLEADGYIVTDAHERADVVYSLRDIIKYSSNVGISLSVEDYLGFDKFYDAILKYRLNTLTGVDYPGEQLGYLLDFDYWSHVQAYNVTFGQGISVNAFQMTAFYGALMNDGVEQTPHFLIRKPQTDEWAEYETYDIIENKEAIEPMVSMLESVVAEGTGIDAQIEGYTVAGKTSTAEVYDEENGGYKVSVYTMAFTGFLADSTSPLVCFVNANDVPAERPVSFIFKDIMEHAINRYNITSK